MGQASAFDWSQFRLGVYLDGVTPDDVYAMWSTAEGLMRWFLREAEFAQSDSGPPTTARERRTLVPFEELTPRSPSQQCQVHDRYRWEWYYGGGIRGEHWILEARPPSKIVFGFGENMTVEVTIRRRGSSCEVTLRQFDIPTTLRARHDIHVGCRIGWTFFLANLKSLAEGGIDLRETNLQRARELHLINI